MPAYGVTWPRRPIANVTGAAELSARVIGVRAGTTNLGKMACHRWV
jgi:hypothetical protein